MQHLSVTTSSWWPVQGTKPWLPPLCVYSGFCQRSPVGKSALTIGMVEEGSRAQWEGEVNSGAQPTSLWPAFPRLAGRLWNRREEASSACSLSRLPQPEKTEDRPPLPPHHHLHHLLLLLLSVTIAPTSPWLSFSSARSPRCKHLFCYYHYYWPARWLPMLYHGRKPRDGEQHSMLAMVLVR